MLTPDEQTLSNARPNTVDRDALSQLYYLGNYKRKLPTNMARMMENARDWEHLPYVHASSFAAIDLIEAGDWGWRAKIGLHGGGHQLLDLIIDTPNTYWVSTVYAGPGVGTQIHTEATTLNDTEIEVDVRFYLPEPPADSSLSTTILSYLRDQYRQLYDEDIGLMSGRQSALNDRVRWRQYPGHAEPVCVGVEAEFDRRTAHVVELESGRYCLRDWNGTWIVHSAVCPHLLGPLEDGELDAKGQISCPWHGYKFNVLTGENVDGHCKPLAPAPQLTLKDGRVYLIPAT